MSMQMRPEGLTIVSLQKPVGMFILFCTVLFCSLPLVFLITSLENAIYKATRLKLGPLLHQLSADGPVTEQVLGLFGNILPAWANCVQSKKGDPKWNNGQRKFSSPGIKLLMEAELWSVKKKSVCKANTSSVCSPKKLEFVGKEGENPSNSSTSQPLWSTLAVLRSFCFIEVALKGSFRITETYGADAGSTATDF